ncbi:MAG: hypothetical protein K6E91_13250 [Butyrivibrio sp.]|nr:hypothetical protein [Butyrivibrio sp.]
MLTVVLIWIYVIITTYLTGYGLLVSLVDWPVMRRKRENGREKKYDFRSNLSFVTAGVVIVTVYAQIFSLFGGVGFAANLILVLACAVIFLYFRYDIYENVFHMARALRNSRRRYVYLAVFLLMAYGTSHGIMHYDSDLYHAQAIEWIEQYGIVKGLGNLHVRLAYNSAAFPLTALYSFRFLGGQSYHVMSGFFALILSFKCVEIIDVFRRGHLVISDFARVTAMYYLFNIYDEMMAPASDYFLSCIVFYTIISWLDLYVRHERSYLPYILLSLLGIYAITIKLSASPMILLSAIPIFKLLHRKTKEKTKAFWISVLLAFVIAVPFLARNVIIAGWILYPVTFLDFFYTPWKIPKGLAEYDALEIRTFGRGYNDVAAYGHVSFSEWVPNWFGSITGLNRIMLILCIVSVFIYLAYLGYFIYVMTGKKYGKLHSHGESKIFDLSRRSMLGHADFLTIGATLIGCLLFWFFSAPLIRYGVVYVFLTPAVIIGRLFIVIYNRISEKAKRAVIKAVMAIICIWCFYKCAILVLEDVHKFNPQYLVGQQDYGEYAYSGFSLGKDVIIYYPDEGDRIGYYPFPAATHDLVGEVELIGEKITDGFRMVDSE